LIFRISFLIILFNFLLCFVPVLLQAELPRAELSRAELSRVECLRAGPLAMVP